MSSHGVERCGARGEGSPSLQEAVVPELRQVGTQGYFIGHQKLFAALAEQVWKCHPCTLFNSMYAKAALKTTQAVYQG